jgi:hypothetical protein
MGELNFFGKHHLPGGKPVNPELFESFSACLNQQPEDF